MAYSAINVIFAILNFAVLCTPRPRPPVVHPTTHHRSEGSVTESSSATERALAHECFYRHWSHFYQCPSTTTPNDASSSPSGSNLPPRFELDEDRFLALLTSAHADQDALMQHGGSWDSAIAAGHTFAASDDTHIPWQMIGGGDEIDAFMARVAEQLPE